MAASENPTLAGAPAESAGATTSEEEELDLVPLSFAQRRLWFLDRLFPEDRTTYNVPGLVWMRGALDAAALSRSVAEIVARHEILRTAFVEEQDEPVQLVLEELRLPMPEEDLTGLQPAEREPAARRRAAEFARESFDLARPPLLRIALLRLAEDEHVLLVNMHHIVADGWSLGVFVRELIALYDGFAHRGRPPLPELGIQYADFALWQHEWLTGARLAGLLEFWRRTLAEPLPVLELPSDRPGSAEARPRGDKLTWQVAPELVAALESRAREANATLFMAFLAAFDLFLFRYTGQEDLLVGTPVAGRSRAEIESLIGFFVNTLVLRTALAGEPSFRELLGRVRQTTIAAFEHQEMPFERLVEELRPERHLGRTPIFQVMFSFIQDIALARHAARGLEMRFEQIEPAGTKFDFSLDVVRIDGGLRAKLQYNAVLFDRTTIRRMRHHFERLLEAALAAPERALRELPFLSAAEQAQLGREWNDTAAAVAGGTLVERLARRAAEHPEAPAVVTSERRLSYGELHLAAQDVARELRRRGVGREVVVGLVFERGAEALVALLAVLKTGGAYLPLDPATPAQRLAWMLDDSGCSLLLTTAALAPRLTGYDVPVLATDRLAGDRSAAGDTVAAAAAGMPGAPTPWDLAYVIYTSGSTGRPKGVLVARGGLLNYALAIRERYGLERHDRVLHFASLAFDVAAEEILPAWLAGAAVVVAPSRLHASYRELGDFLGRYRVSVVNLPASYWHGWVEELTESRSPLPPVLRLLVVGSEAVSPQRLAAWRELATRSVEVCNVYGPTEATIGATLFDPGPGPAAWPGACLPIGRPLANVSVHLLDRRGQVVAAGVTGELHVGGCGVARGYLKRPRLTAQRFLPDPFAGAQSPAGGRLYRTGDLARYLGDGTIRFLGRADHQVKLRGFRIELGEIEAALKEHPEVAAAAVVAAAPTVGGEPRLTAFVVPAVGAPMAAGPRELARWVSSRLAAYMVPSAFVVLERLPRTPGGKVDRAALAARPLTPPAANADFVAPRGEIETALAAIWAEVLDLPRVGANAHFFELGGHSLLVAKLISRLRRELDVELPMRGPFEHPVLADMAALIASLGRGAAGPPPAPADRDQPLPLSFGQERLWFLDQLDPGNPAYNVPDAVRIRGGFVPAAWAAALTGLVRRHESLRTTFHGSRQGVVQVVGAAAPLSAPIVDLAGLAPAPRLGEARRLAAAESLRPFDLGGGPLLRSRLLRLAADEWILLLTVHHIVSDGWSYGILVRELRTLYGAALAGVAAELPALPVQYADYAVWQRRRLTGEVLAGELATWRRLVGEAAVLELPTDRPRPARQSFHGNRQTLVLDGGAAQRLAEFGRRRDATLFITLLAAFEALLGRLTGAESFCLGTPVAGRRQLEVEELIGLFVNTLALRADLSGDPSFDELHARVRETVLEAQAHQDFPFEVLVDELEPTRDLSRSPIFQVMLVLQSHEMPSLTLPGVAIEPFATENRTAKFDLTLAVVERPEGLFCSLEYSTDLFDATTARRCLRQLEHLLRALVAAPERPLREVSLLTPAALHQLLREWNATADVPPSAAGLADLFEAQAARRPEALALIAGEGRLSYRELDERANRLARHLQRSGVEPEQLVGISMSRGAGMIVAMLGILKAGSAYLPLDPAYPPARLVAMLEDAAAPVLLTEAARRGALPEYRGRSLELDAADRPWRALETTPPPRPGAADHLAYAIYTSGSTGRPKGVAITHRSAVALLAWAREVFPARDRERVLAATSICFDLSVYEIFLTLTTGGTLVLAENALALPELGDARITLVNTVPSAMAELVRMAGFPASVRTVNLAGEPLRQSLIDAIYDLGGVEKVYNLYGPSEDTTYSTFSLLRRRAPFAPPIGRPLAGTRVYLLDARGGIPPIGVAGELYLAGAGLARGYWRRPALTAGRFVPDRFAATAGARLYRSGDLARFRSDGELDFLGRTDHQVKVRGFRIELGEIETALLRHPEVRQAVVLAREDHPGDKLLVAYVVAEPGCRPEAGTLRSFLHQALPAFMVPAAVVTLEALPLLPNGKLDRRRLPAPRDLGREAAAETPPSTPLETLVAEIWAEVLGLGGPDSRPIGATASFFDLGGHSLSATRVAARLREALGRDVPLRALFEHRTVAALARFIESCERRELELELPELVADPERGCRAPLSFAQQRLWFLHQLEPAASAYHLAAAVELLGTLEPTALERSFTELVRRHEILRTRFVQEAGELVQLVDPPFPWPLPRVDLGALPAASAAAVLERLVAAETRRPFDLARGPLLRTRLVHLGDRRHVLILTQHHIVADGWSIALLVRQMGVLYEGFATGRGAALEELPVQYADYARWQRRTFSGELLQRQLEFWKEALGEEPPELQLPTDFPRTAAQHHPGGWESRRLPATLTRRLHALAREEAATPFMVLLAAFALLLARLSGQDRVVIGSPIAGRQRRETELLLGCFLNTLAIRVDLDGAPSFRALLGRVRHTVLGAYVHQDLPFEKLVEEVRPQRDVRRTPLFEAMLNFLNLPAAGIELPDLRLAYLPVPEQQAKYALTLYALEHEDGLELRLAYQSDLFRPARMQRLLRQLEVLLDRTLADPEAAVSAHSLLGEEREAWRPAIDGPLAAAALPSVPQLFAARAAERGDRPAILQAERAWSYAELAGWAAVIARRLLAAGLQRGGRVALLGPRSPGLIAALLGVLGAGGVFLTLDRRLPGRRQQTMLAEGGARHLLVIDEPPGVPAEIAALPEVEVLRLAGWEVPPEAAAGDAFAALDLPGAGSDEAAYVFFTSGTTGVPKGVLGRHNGLSHFLLWQRDEFGIGPDDRVAQLTGLSFDVMLRDVLLPLVSGAALCLPHEDDPGADRILPWLQASGVTAVHVVPALARFWISSLAAASGAAAAPALERLRWVFFAGEPLTDTLVRRWRETFPRSGGLVNLYGPTETTLAKCFFHVPPEPLPGVQPVGRPIPGAQAAVLGPAGQLCDLGEVGEIVLRTPYRSLGYLNRPGETAARFRANPFRPEAEDDLLYFTGDRGRMRLDGTLEILGRVDDQVKIRGMRVELGEVKAVLERHPAVLAAECLAFGEAPDEKFLAAYLVLRPAATADVTAIRRELRETLPDYMVPATLMTLDALPLTPNGKVDRRRLPAPEMVRPAPETAYLAPGDELESAIAAIWESLLPVARVGVDDNFFDLGGHSLLLVQVRDRLQRELGREIPMLAMFQYPTIRSLAGHLSGASAGTPAAGTPAAGYERAERRTAVRERAAGRRDKRRGSRK